MEQNNQQESYEDSKTSKFFVQVDRLFVEFAKQLNLYLNHFPSHEKFGLCQYIRDSLYQVYGLITEIRKRHHKKTALSNLDIEHEKLRMYIRLAYELGYFSHNKKAESPEQKDKQNYEKYLKISVKVDQLGKFIGSMIKTYS